MKAHKAIQKKSNEKSFLIKKKRFSPIFYKWIHNV